MILRLRDITQWSVVVALLIGVAAAPVLAQRQGRIIGTVVDDEGNLIEGVLIVADNPDLLPPRFDTTTGADGRYSILGFIGGLWNFTASKEGYQSVSTPVRVGQGGNRRGVDFTLTRIRHPLEIELGEAALEGLDPEAIERELEEANVAYNRQDWDAAIAGYTSILEKLPQMSNLYLQIGHAHRANEDYEAALAVYERMREAHPTNDQVDAEIARTKLAMGDFAAASEELAASASGLGAQREDLYNLGELEFATGAVDEAATWYEKAAAADPSWGKPLFKLALVALNKGDTEAAKEYFEKVIAVDPDSEEGAQAKATLAALP